MDSLSGAQRDALYIPICQQLVNHVKRLDGFKVSTQCQLPCFLGRGHTEIEVSIIYHCKSGDRKPKAQVIPFQGEFDEEHLRDDQQEFLLITLKLNQVFALLDVDLKKQHEKPEEQMNDILKQLQKNGGLDYIPRERTPQGRLFEHACDTKILLKLLYATKNTTNEDLVKDITQEVYYIKVEKQIQQQNHENNESINSQTTLTTQEEEHVDGVDGHSSSTTQQTKDYIFTIKKNFVDLAIKSNGKAELYFHSYFWYFLILNLYMKTHPQSTEQQFETNVVKQSLEVQRLQGLSDSLKKVHANINKFPFNKEIYERIVNDFGGRKVVKKLKLIEDIQRSLFVAQIIDDKQALYWIEKILIQLLGYFEMSIRDQAVILLNMLYDEIDWQLQSPFKPVVRVVGQHFKVNVIVDYAVEKNTNTHIFLGLNAPSPIEGINQTILTWHKIDQRNIVKSGKNETEISINFGKFWKCGFFDWKLITISDNGKLQPLEMIAQPEALFTQINSMKQSSNDYYDDNDVMGSLAQGRFIVHAKGIRDHIFHEVYVDYQNAEIDTKNSKFIKRGDFHKVEKAIDSYKKRGITTLYLMGVLERDNYPFFNKNINELEFRKPDATPLAITCRQTANNMLGGDQGFQSLMKQAKQSKIKIVIDCLTRISSSRNHRKYRDLMLYYLDEEGRKKICYGTDGQSINYEDTALLNYRKIESWNLLINEVIGFTSKHGINGIHLDNGQAWPQIMEPDLEELMRLDVDGNAAYQPIDVMNGEVVLRNENYGYWNTNTMESYPNPFFIKLCKRLWEQFPDFMIIGECWGGFKFENRQIILSRSGVIPRMYKMPQALSSIFGKKLFKDGRVTECEKENVLSLKKWYESNRMFLPEGTILIQSSSAHQWPYPAYLYGKGTWAAVDVLYFMPDIPITFMGEIDGEVYRIGTTQVFQHEQTEVKSTGLKRSNSQLMMALQQQDARDDYQPNQLINADSKNDSGPGTPEGKRMVKVRSGSNLAALVVEQKQGQDIKLKEENFKAQIGPQFGFDLSKISSHYEHRRRLRRDKMVLRYGELIPLVARKNDKEWEMQVLAYARYSLVETAIIVTNLSDKDCTFYVDLTQLQSIFFKTYPNNSVVMVTEWLQQEYQPQYFFLKELLNKKNYITLKGYHSSIQGITLCQDDPFVIKKALTSSIERTKLKLNSGQSIESEQVSLLFTDILENNPEDIVKFANVIGSLQENFLDKINMSFYDLFVHNEKLKNNSSLSSKLMALCHRIIEIAEDKEIPPKIAASSIIDNNKLGPIVFCAPELGRWSTVGGLGVMVDELSIGLAELGHDVTVISPYYERNRKGETGYLAKDPAGITYRENINISLPFGGVLGVHEGFVSGVKVIFLHNAQIFPSPYPDSGCYDTVKQLAVFGKGCLEFLCRRQIIPAVCVTNDWFTGLIPAYAKVGAFGDTFKGTTFLHIAHNLEPTYEGRLFPSPQDGSLEHVHQLPREWLIDPYWAKPVINPSRCAIMLSDQWATVSPSYKEDLLRTSPLQDLLRQKSQPFAFPNGIPVAARVKKLDEVAPDHATAKKLIQKKYFGYSELDDEVPLLSFVGRITAQKGVHLILDAAESLIQRSNYKVNILVGGAANMKEPYSAQCANKMWHLRNKYGSCFWADPNQFFTDGSLVNRGSDFGLMPSVFEPGGIVQHEFFVGGTPVVAFKTGGLKDSVFEFMWDSEQGNGYTFQNHNVQDFIFACERALGTYKNKAKYQKLRQNAFYSTMDGEKVSKAWLQEFYRLRGKVYVDEAVIKDALLKMGVWSPSTYKGMQSIEEMFGIDKKIDFSIDDIDFGAEEEKEVFEEEKTSSKQKVVSHFENPKDDKFPHVFMMHNNGPQYQQVELCGTFDDWKVRHKMSFDNYTKQWFITLHLGKGKYHYKYVVNNKDWVMNDKEPREKDNLGNFNNLLVL